MNSSSIHDDLLERYFRSEIDADEGQELQRVLAADEAFAERFAQRARLESDLGEFFKLRRVTATAEDFAHAAAIRSSAWRYRWIVAGNAALLALCVGSFWWVASHKNVSDDQPVAGPVAQTRSGARVISGQVVGADGERLEVVDEGETARCVEAAVLEMKDGSRIVLEAQTKLTWVVPGASERAVVEVDAGGARFLTARAAKPLVVNTPVGSIQDKGSEFTVNLRPAELPSKKGAEKMKLSTVMMVVVAAGLVEVNVGGVTYNLAGGQSRSFAAEKKAPQPPTHTIKGTIAAIGTSSVTLSGKNEKGIYNTEVPVNANTKILIETDEDEPVNAPGKKGMRPKEVPGTLTSLTVGEFARVTVADGGDALEILQLRHHDTGKKKGDGTPTGKGGGTKGESVGKF